MEEENQLSIRIGNYVIRRLDQYNITVDEIKVIASGENAGQEYPKNIGYYKKLYKAIDKLLDLQIEKKSIKDLKELAVALKDAESSLRKALDEEYKNFNELKG